MPIAVLADEVVDRIAAGEAVERPASAVKELIENAIDAGATSAHVETVAGGRTLLRVSDNGSGIRAKELALAFKRHATSKLRDADELRAINTLGFRGEALASIAAVSQTTVVTRHREERMGLRLRLDGGAAGHQQAVGAPVGSVVTIENLFFNTPARLKFLKSDNTEKRHIYWVVARYALAYPEIAFALIQDGRERFRSTGSGQLTDVVARVFGVKEFRSMLPVQLEEPARPGRVAIGVKGYISLPALHRASRDRIILFVNGRAVQDISLTRAVTQAYDGVLQNGQFPLAVMMLSVPPDFVDVNVHPTKAEVRFRDSQQAFRALHRAVRQTLQTAEGAEYAEGRLADGERYDPFDASQVHDNWRHAIATDDPFDNYGIERIPGGADMPERPRTLPPLRVLGQAGATYIIAEGPAGLYLVDQNAAHERLLYQRLRRDLSNGGVASEAASESLVFALSPDDARLLEETAQLFAELGFELEVFGPNTFVARTLPSLLSGQQLGDAIPLILQRLRAGERSLTNATAALAAAAAIKRGQVMDRDEMRELLAELERCPEPHSAPGGNKTLVHITSEQLSAEFQA